MVATFIVLSRISLGLNSIAPGAQKDRVSPMLLTFDAPWN